MFSQNPIRFNAVSSVVTSLTSKDPELGTIVQEGQLHYCFVYNDGGVEVYPGYGLVLNSAATGYSCTVSSVSSTDNLMGVVRNSTFPVGGYGWAVVRGITPVQMGTTLSAPVRGLVGLGTSGVFAPVSAATGNIGNAFGVFMTAGVSAASASAFINVY